MAGVSNGSPPEGVGPILLVDEDAEVRRVLARRLGRAGYRVCEAETGDAGLEAAQEERPSLVILEVCLSDICGYAVCQELRERLGEDVPIILVSAKRTESCDRVAGLLVGADEYLTKPLAPDEVVARVRRLARRPPALVSNLTARELEVLGLLAQGLTPKETATRLFVSPKTVDTHIENIFRKLGVRTRSQAVAVAYRDALVGSRR